jgi:hypothetical protein
MERCGTDCRSTSVSLRSSVRTSRPSALRLPEVEYIRPGHDAPGLPADPHEHGLAVEEQHLQESCALALVHDRERRAHEVPYGLVRHLGVVLSSRHLFSQVLSANRLTSKSSWRLAPSSPWDGGSAMNLSRDCRFPRQCFLLTGSRVIVDSESSNVTLYSLKTGSLPIKIGVSPSLGMLATTSLNMK